MVTTVGTHTMWVTSVDGVEHVMSERRFAAQLRSGGPLGAVCGAWFWPAAMAAAPSRSCKPCVARQTPEPDGSAQGRRPRHRWPFVRLRSRVGLTPVRASDP